jgi:hypothetical protein
MQDSYTHSKVWIGMIVVAIVLSLIATAAIILGYHDAKRRGEPFRPFSRSLPGLDMFGVWALLFFVPSGLNGNGMYMVDAFDGVALAGLIASVFRYGLILSGCSRSGWTWRDGLGQAWSILVPGLFAVLVVRHFRVSPVYFWEPLVFIAVAGLVTPFFVRGVYIRRQAELAEKQ